MKLFFHVPEMYKIYPFLFFLTETSEQHKGRPLAVVAFRLFLSTRLVSSRQLPFKELVTRKWQSVMELQVMARNYVFIFNFTFMSN